MAFRHREWIGLRPTCPNLPEAWRRFKQQAELMFSGPLREKCEPEKCSYLMLWIGEKGLDIYNTWSLSEDKAKKLQTYYDKYTAYITPKSNPIYARYRFHEKMQADGEMFEHFITELKLLVKDCGYPNSDEMVRDRIVFATNSPRVREKLLSCVKPGSRTDIRQGDRYRPFPRASTDTIKGDDRIKRRLQN